MLVGALSQSKYPLGQTLTYASQDGDSMTPCRVQVHLYLLVSGTPSHAFAHPHVAASLVEVDN